MRVGVQLPEVEYEARRDELAAMARAAEETGFDSVWVGDHLLYRDPVRGPWDCWTTLAWLAGITERVELGPLVACTAFHPPGVLARMAAATPRALRRPPRARSRRGWNEVEFRAFGLPFDHLVSRFEEAFEIVRRLLAGDEVTFHGRFHQADDAVLLPTPATGPKLMVGANGPRMLSIGLPHVESGTPGSALRQHGRRLRRGERRDRRGGRAGGTRPGDARAERLRPRRGRRAGHARTTTRARRPCRPPRTGRTPAGWRRPARTRSILVADPITEASIRSLRTVIPTA